MIKLLLHPAMAGALAVILIVALNASDFGNLWFWSFAAFYGSLIALGWRKAPPVLVWIVAVNMLTVWADIVMMELSSVGGQTVRLEPHLPEAIFNASCAIFFVAAGMGLTCRHRAGYARHAGAPVPRLADCDVRLLFGAYLIFLPVSIAVRAIAGVVPALSQPAIAFGALKFVLIYLVAARTFAGNAPSIWLVAVIVIELISGSSGAFSSFKEGFFIVLIALAASERAISLRAVAVAVVGTVVIVYMSIVWSAVKKEFRENIAGGDTLTSISWLADKYFNPNIDFADASTTLLERVSYAKFYAMIIGRDVGEYKGIYLRAIGATLTPRFLFPDKAVLSDSVQTNAILGWNIQSGTSIGLGYVAQANIDFGFPGMALPLAALGGLIGLMYRYFVTRRVPIFVGQAFASGVLFNCLAFAGNIDKQLGGLVMGFIVAAMSIRHGAPPLLRFVRTRNIESETKTPAVARTNLEWLR